MKSILKTLALILSLLITTQVCHAALPGYEVVTCDLYADDIAFKTCACPSGKVALGGACWLYTYGVGKVWAEALTGNAYLCASSHPGDKLYVTVTCVNP